MRVTQIDTPLGRNTTPSLDTLKACSTGWQVVASSGSAAAAPFFQRAAEIDPNFASAYGVFGRMYSDIGESVLFLRRMEAKPINCEMTPGPYKCPEFRYERFIVRFPHLRHIGFSR